MRILIKTLKGESFPLDVEPEATIASIKARVAEQRADLPAARQKLIHAGKILKDDDVVSNTNIKEGEFLVCMVSKEAKKPAPAPEPVAAPATTAAAPSSAATSTTPAPTSAAAPGAPVAAGAPAGGSATPQPGPAVSSAPATPAATYDSPEAVANLTAMGFPESEVRAALNAARGNGDVAVEFLMNPAAMIQATQMQAAQQQAAAAPAATGAGGSGVTLESLRQHPQFAQLRRVVQANPASVNSVLELIGQQSPDLLAAIHEDQQAFMDMMLSDDEPAAPAASGNAAAAAAANAASAGPMGGGMGGAPNMMQIMGMISSLPPEQQAGMLQQMGLTPAQFQAVQEQLASMPPEQLEQLMTQAHGAAGGAPSPDQGQVIQLTSAEMAHVNQLSELGFTQQQAAEAYLVCDKDMDAAAAYLFSQGDS